MMYPWICPQHNLSLISTHGCIYGYIIIIIIIIIILFVHKNNFIKTRQPTTRERDRQG